MHDVSCVPHYLFANPPDAIGSEQIAVGEDVFMIGLFLDHGGTMINIPSARFGNVSMLPNAKATIKQPTGYLGESYVVDMHSRTGFSGSPVYAFRTIGADLTNRTSLDFGSFIVDDGISKIQPGSYDAGSAKLSTHVMFHLIGIHWGQFPERWELRERESLSEAHRNQLIVNGGYIQGMSGMTCVIPTWHIDEVMDMPELKKHRAKKAAVSSEPVAESSPPASGENPIHREDFDKLLGAAVRNKPD
jgi:hypothetical protein